MLSSIFYSYKLRCYFSDRTKQGIYCSCGYFFKVGTSFDVRIIYFFCLICAFNLQLAALQGCERFSFSKGVLQLP